MANSSHSLNLLLRRYSGTIGSQRSPKNALDKGKGSGRMAEREGSKGEAHEDLKSIAVWQGKRGKWA
jgi:hypothetical protein